MSQTEQEILAEFLADHAPADGSDPVTSAQVCEVPRHAGMVFAAATTRSGAGDMFGVFLSRSSRRFDGMFHVPGLLARRCFPLAVAAGGEKGGSGGAGVVAATLVLTDTDELVLVEVSSVQEESDDAETASGAATTVVVKQVAVTGAPLNAGSIVEVAGTYPNRVWFVTESAFLRGEFEAGDDPGACKLLLLASSTSPVSRTLCAAATADKKACLVVLRGDCAENTAAAAAAPLRLLLASDEGEGVSVVESDVPPSLRHYPIAAAAVERTARAGVYLVVVSVATDSGLAPLAAFTVAGASGGRATVGEVCALLSRDAEVALGAAAVSIARGAMRPRLSTDLSLLHADADDGAATTITSLRVSGSNSVHRFEQQQQQSSDAPATALQGCFVSYDVTQRAFVAIDTRGNARFVLDSVTSAGAVPATAALPYFGSYSRVVRSVEAIFSCGQQAFWFCDGEGGVACCVSKAAVSSDGSDEDDEDLADDEAEDGASFFARPGRGAQLPFIRITSVAPLVTSSAVQQQQQQQQHSLLFVIAGVLAHRVPVGAGSAAAATAASLGDGAYHLPGAEFGAVIVSCSNRHGERAPRIVSTRPIELPLRPKCSFGAVLPGDDAQPLLLAFGCVGGTLFVKLRATASDDEEGGEVVFVPEELQVADAPNTSAVIGIFALEDSATAAAALALTAEAPAADGMFTEASTSSASNGSMYPNSRAINAVTLRAPSVKDQIASERASRASAVGDGADAAAGRSSGHADLRLVTIERGGTFCLFRVRAPSSDGINADLLARFKLFDLAGVAPAVLAAAHLGDSAASSATNSGIGADSSTAAAAASASEDAGGGRAATAPTKWINLDTLLISSWHFAGKQTLELSVVFAGGTQPLTLRVDLRKFTSEEVLL